MDRTHHYFKKIFVLLAFVFLLSSPLIARSAELLVQAQLDPFIAVTPPNPTVNITSTSIGDFNGNFSFMVEANVANVSVHAIVTKLYKDTNPNTSGDVAPIAVNTAAGVEIAAFSARAAAGSDLNAAFTSTTSLNKPSGVFDAHQTEQVNLESTQDGVFNQDVELTVTWTRDESPRPAGVYGGYVQLFVSAVP